MPHDVLGRDHELEAIDRFLAGVRAGATALVLEGEAGIGKTTLWDAAVGAAREAGFLVLRSTPAPSEQGLTLGALSDLFADVGRPEMQALPSPQRHALEVALLRVEPSGSLPDQRALSVATATLLRHLSTGRCVLLAIDDGQWLDDSSLAILAYAMRRLRDRSVGLLLSVRGTSGTARTAELVAAAQADRAERVGIGPLSLAALHRLFQQRLERSFPRLALVRIEQTSGGNPLYALEIARALTRAGATLTPGEPLPVPDSLGSLMAARVQALPAETRDALVLAAAAAEPTIETLRRASPPSVEALRPAVDDGLVTVDAGTIRFSHPLLANAAHGLKSPTELRRIHRRLAEASSSEDARARHLGQSADGPEEPVAEALERAAESARMRGATLDAAALYQESSRLTPDRLADRSLTRAMLAAECLFVDLSEIVQADDILEAAVGRAPAGPTRADALSLRALLRYYHGRVAEAARLAEQALAEAGGDSELRARVLVRTAFTRMQVDLEGGVAQTDEAVRVLDALPGPVDPDLLSSALLLRAVGELGLVRHVRFDEIERGLRLMTRDGRTWEHESADGSAFGIARLTDDLDRAIEMTLELIRAKSGPGGDDPFNLVQLSGLYVYRGNWTEARRLAEVAMEGYDREGADVHPSWRLRGLALVAAHEGRLEEARTLAAEGLALAVDRGDVVLNVFHRGILGFVALSLGEWQTADAQLTEAAALAESSGTRHPGRFKLDGDRVEAALAVGDIERAAGIVAWLQHTADVAPTPWVLAVGLRCRSLVAAARGDLDSAVRALDEALVGHDRLEMPFERGRTLLVKGQIHRRRKEKRLADDCLRESVRIFEQLGAAIWAARAQAELGRVGLRPRAPDDLTETERTVAELAAAGLNSRQIAERAFLAPKTVGNVLGRIYLKLGIHSRAELGALLGAGRQEHRDAGPAAALRR